MKNLEGEESGRMGPVEGINRRGMLRLLGGQLGTCVGLAQLAPVICGQSRAQRADGWEPLNRFPRMMQEFFVRQLSEFAEARHDRLARLQTRDDAERYVRLVRDRIRTCFGPSPERTPLRPRITGVVERDAYRIEKMIFESRPGFLVSANLYVPRREEKLPGVVGTCGHSSNGKAAEPYQAFAQGLARQGYVVLIYDPIGQGERLQYVGADLKSRIGPGVAEHLMAGNQQTLVGEFLGQWRAWDGIRALDYLLSRPEVDPKRVGVTGNSGGGTMTTWLCGLDDRWSMAAPSCFVTSFVRNLENELPADTEQCPPQALALGLDHEDFLAAMAPKPIIILAKERDYFDVRGSEAAFGRLKRLYGLLDAPENISLFVGPTGHGFSQENREAMYAWFNSVTGISDRSTEPALALEEDETLWCTPNGQVAELDSRTVFSFTREASSRLASRRPRLTKPALLEGLRHRLQLPPRGGVPGYRILRPLPARGYPRPRCTTYAVATEAGIWAAVYRLSEEAHYSRPPQSDQPAVVYVSHHSADAELRSEPLIGEILQAEPGSSFFGCDVRGIGESKPDTCGAESFLKPYGSDYFYAAHSLMLGRPYVGQKTHDVLAVLDWIASFGHRRIHLVARGWGALPATFAALLHDSVAAVTLKNALTSFRDVAEAEEYRWPLSAFVPGVLREFDLPDCYEQLQERSLRLIEPWDATSPKTA